MTTKKLAKDMKVFFGILDDGEDMQDDLKRIKAMNISLLEERLKMYETS